MDFVDLFRIYPQSPLFACYPILRIYFVVFNIKAYSTDSSIRKVPVRLAQATSKEIHASSSIGAAA